MNKLYVITTSIDDANKLAFRLGVSNELIKALTCVDDLKIVPNQFVFMDDSSHPLDGVIIRDRLSEMQSNGAMITDVKTESNLSEILEAIRILLSQYNQKVDGASDQTLTRCIHELEDRLMTMGFQISAGFRFNILYDYIGRYLWIQPLSDKMDLIINLYKGYILNLSHKIKPVNGLDLTRVNSIRL